MSSYKKVKIHELHVIAQSQSHPGPVVEPSFCLIGANVLQCLGDFHASILISWTFCGVLFSILCDAKVD
jgi:hypothetical protein